MDTNKKIEANSSSFGDIEEKIHANQVLYDQLHQSLVDESIAQVDEDERSGRHSASKISDTETIFSRLSKLFLDIPIDQPINDEMNIVTINGKITC